MNSGFRSEVDENCAHLGCYAACSVIILQTFRDNLSVPSSGVKNPKIKTVVTLVRGLYREGGGIRSQQRGGSWHQAAETSVRHYHYCPRNSPE